MTEQQTNGRKWRVFTGASPLPGANHAFLVLQYADEEGNFKDPLADGEAIIFRAGPEDNIGTDFENVKGYKSLVQLNPSASPNEDRLIPKDFGKVVVDIGLFRGSSDWKKYSEQSDQKLLPVLEGDESFNIEQHLKELSFKFAAKILNYNAALDFDSEHANSNTYAAFLTYSLLQLGQENENTYYSSQLQTLLAENNLSDEDLALIMPAISSNIANDRLFETFTSRQEGNELPGWTNFSNIDISKMPLDEAKKILTDQQILRDYFPEEQEELRSLKKELSFLETTQFDDSPLYGSSIDYEERIKSLKEEIATKESKLNEKVQSHPEKENIAANFDEVITQNFKVDRNSDEYRENIKQIITHIIDVINNERSSINLINITEHEQAQSDYIGGNHGTSNNSQSVKNSKETIIDRTNTLNIMLDEAKELSIDLGDKTRQDITKINTYADSITTEINKLSNAEALDNPAKVDSKVDRNSDEYKSNLKKDISHTINSINNERSSINLTENLTLSSFLGITDDMINNSQSVKNSKETIIDRVKKLNKLDNEAKELSIDLGDKTRQDIIEINTYADSITAETNKLSNAEAETQTNNQSNISSGSTKSTASFASNMENYLGSNIQQSSSSGKSFASPAYVEAPASNTENYLGFNIQQSSSSGESFANPTYVEAPTETSKRATASYNSGKVNQDINTASATASSVNFPINQPGQGNVQRPISSATKPSQVQSSSVLNNVNNTSATNISYAQESGNNQPLQSFVQVADTSQQQKQINFLYQEIVRLNAEIKSLSDSIRMQNAAAKQGNMPPIRMQNVVARQGNMPSTSNASLTDI